jgi:hypothetical protein
MITALISIFVLLRKYEKLIIEGLALESAHQPMLGTGIPNHLCWSCYFVLITTIPFCRPLSMVIYEFVVSYPPPLKSPQYVESHNPIFTFLVRSGSLI